MRPNDVSKALAALVPTRRPIYLWGPPGVGKSSLVRQAAKTSIWTWSTSGPPCSTRSTCGGCPGDPRRHGRLVPAGVPAQGRAGPAVPGRVGPGRPAGAGRLPATDPGPPGRRVRAARGWSVVAASNRAEDRAGTHRLITPLLNRFVHLDLDVSADDWQDWAVAAGLSPEVRAFLRYRPALLFQFDPAATPAGLPDPAGLAVRLGRPGRDPGRVAAPGAWPGASGDGPAAEFVGFLRLYRELPDLDEVLARPDAGPGAPRAGRPVRPGRGPGRAVPADQAPLAGFVAVRPAAARGVRRPGPAGRPGREPEAGRPAGRPAVDRPGPRRRACSWPPDAAYSFAQSQPQLGDLTWSRADLDVGGAVTFWSLADWSDRPPTAGRLRRAWAWTPSSPTPGRPRPVCGRPGGRPGRPRVLVRPLASPRRVRRRPRGPRAGGQRRTPPLLTARVRDGHDPMFDPWTPGRRPGGRRLPPAARPGPGRADCRRPWSRWSRPWAGPAAARRGRLLGARPAARRLGRGRPGRRAGGRGPAQRRVRAAAPAGRGRRPGRPGRRGHRGPGRSRPDLRRGRGRRAGRPGPGDPEEAGGRPAGQGAAVRGPAQRRPGGLHQAVDQADQAAATAALLLGRPRVRRAVPRPGSANRSVRSSTTYMSEGGDRVARPRRPFAALEQAAARQAAEEQAARGPGRRPGPADPGPGRRAAFFATLVLRLQPEPAWDLDTLATDGRSWATTRRS